jgi:hypothetical protein
MKNILIIFAVFLTGLAEGQPFSLHPDYLHYFLYNGEPTVLITSAEYYGAVINGTPTYSEGIPGIENKTSETKKSKEIK